MSLYGIGLTHLVASLRRRAHVSTFAVGGIWLGLKIVKKPFSAVGGNVLYGAF